MKKKARLKVKYQKPNPKALVVVGRGKPKKKRGTDNLSPVLWGNEFWKQRSKHGRDKLFVTPELLLEAASEYFTWCDNNPDHRAELVKHGGRARQVKISLRRPYTMQGLCLYLDCNTSYFRQFKATLHAKISDGTATTLDYDFTTVLHRILEIVYNQQLGGALTGHFNSNIVAKLLGLVDRLDVTTANEPLSPAVVKVFNIAPPLAAREDEIVL